MTLALTGLSHHTSPLALRERMTLSTGNLADLLSAFQKELGPESGVALLATCNRIEVYACAKIPPERLYRKMVQFLGKTYQLAESEFSGFLYFKAEAEAVTHLFRVAASLDSMVVGENEILGQIQQMLDTARVAGTLNRVLSALLQRSLKCGKRVRTETQISKGKVSVASIAVDLVESILKDLHGKAAMIIGSGQVGELAMKSLVERGVNRVMVLNRTLERAKALARRYHGEAIILEALPCHLHRADIVISSTGASELILKASDFERAIEQRGRAPMIVIDIAIPRDIEREAGGVDNVYCYDMDDLQGVAERNLSKRQEEIAACMDIVRCETSSFLNWRHRLNVDPVISALTCSFNQIREKELQHALRKLSGLTEEERRVVEYLSKRITNSLLRKPVDAVKRALPEEQEMMTAIMERFFSLGDSEPL